MENRGDRIVAHSAPSEWVPAGGRLEWIDVARGLGIIAVVIGHVWTRGPLRDAMYSFHMPLFFLLSGLLARPQPVAHFTSRLFASQMRPYAAFLILLVLLDQLIEHAKGNRPIFSDWPQDLLPILLGGSWLRGPFTIFWFVPCLMVARIIFNALLTRWPDPLDRRWAMLLLPCALIAYALGMLTQMSVLGLLTVPMAIILLWVGAAWQPIPWRSWMWLPLGLLSVAGLAGLIPELNLKAADYGWPLLSMGSAVATSLLIFRAAVRIAPFAGWLAVVGRTSLVIMYLHVAVVHYLTPHLDRVWLPGPALLLPIVVHHLLNASRIGRRIFL